MEQKYNLSNTGNRKPFSVPDNYFEDFASQFESQITLKRVSPIKLMRPWMYMAAMFLGIFALSRLAYNYYSESKIAQAENYELYVLTQLNNIEAIGYYEQIETDNKNLNQEQ
jgi:hypothetical protein